MLYLKIYINEEWLAGQKPFIHNHNENFEFFKNNDELMEEARRIIENQHKYIKDLYGTTFYSKIEGYMSKQLLWEMKL